MAGEALEELLQALRAVSATLNAKLSNLAAFLVQYKNASSVGAIAGFAFVLVCTWKYMKTTSRQPKQGAKLDNSAASTSSSSSQGVSTALAPAATQPRQRGISIQETSSAVQTLDRLQTLTLGQLVKRQLKGGRKVTCHLLGVVFQESSTSELEKHAVVRPAAIDVLLALARCCDLYLLARVSDDASEEVVLDALDKVGLFSKSGFNRNKVLFCSSEAGRCSFVRQLEPDWHIDTSEEFVRQLARYIHHQLYVTATPRESSVAPNVVESETLESYFASG